MAAGAYDSASDIMQGQMLIYVDDTLFAFSTSTELALNTNMVDTSNQLDGGWESSLPGKKGWTLNGQSFVTQKQGALSADELLAKQISGQTLTIWFGKCTITDNAEGGVDVIKGSAGWTGKAHITGCTVTSEAGNLIKFQCNMQGTGALKSAGE
jgi:hypothetical protein